MCTGSFAIGLDVGCESVYRAGRDRFKRIHDVLFGVVQVRVLEVTAVDAAAFHARFSARERRYVYRLVTGRRYVRVFEPCCTSDQPRMYTVGRLTLRNVKRF